MALSIKAVLEYYGAQNVPEAVGWRSIRCPFHSDTHASGRVNVELDAYKCHGCDMSGTALSLIQRKENLSREAACEFAGSIPGAGDPEISRTVHKQPKIRPLGRNKWKDILA